MNTNDIENRITYLSESTPFRFKKPRTTLKWGGDDGSSFELNIDKKFNWFQKKMLKMFFGFEVKENK